MENKFKVDESFLKTAQKIRKSEIIKTEDIIRRKDNMGTDIIEDIDELIRSEEQRLSVFFNQKYSLAYLFNKVSISVFSFNEIEKERLYQKIYPSINTKILRIPPIFFSTQDSLFLIFFSRTHVFMQNLFAEKSQQFQFKLIDKIEEVRKAVVTCQNQKTTTVKILFSNLILKELIIDCSGRFLITLEKNQLVLTQRNILPNLSKIFSSQAPQNESNVNSKLIFKKFKKKKLTLLVAQDKIRGILEEQKNSIFRFKEINLIKEITEFEKKYLKEQNLTLINIKILDTILLEFQGKNPLLACVYTIYCTKDSNYAQMIISKVSIFIYQPTQLKEIQNYLLQEKEADITILTDYQLLTQHNFDNNNNTNFTELVYNDKIFIILKYYSLHEDIRIGYIFEINLNDQSLVEKILDEYIFGGGVFLGNSRQNKHNFFVVIKDKMIFFEDYQHNKLKQLKFNDSIPFFDVGLNKSILPNQSMQSFQKYSKINCNDEIIENIQEEENFEESINKGFQIYLIKKDDQKELQKYLDTISKIAEEIDASVTLMEIIQNIFDKQTQRLTTATKILREDLQQVNKKQKQDSHYSDSITLDLKLKKKELDKFYQFISLISFPQNYNDCFQFCLQCSQICKNALIFRKKQLESINNKKIFGFIEECIQNIFDLNKRDNTDIIYANLSVFNNIFKEFNKQVSNQLNHESYQEDIIIFIVQLYRSIFKKMMIKIQDNDHKVKLKVMLKKKDNIFQQFLAFNEILLKKNHKIFQNEQIKDEFESLNKFMLNLSFLLFRYEKISQSLYYSYVDLIFKKNINDQNCLFYFDYAQNSENKEKIFQIFFQFDIPVDKLNIHKNENNQQILDKEFLTEIILEGIKILKNKNSNSVQKQRVSDLFKKLQDYSFEIVEILEKINQKHLLSLFSLNYQEEIFLQNFPVKSNNRKLNCLIKCFDQITKRNPQNKLNLIDIFIQKFRLLKPNQRFDLVIVLKNIQIKMSKDFFKQGLQLLKQLQENQLSQDQQSQSKILICFKEILSNQLISNSNTQKVTQKMIINIPLIEELASRFPENQKLDNFIKKIKDLAQKQQSQNNQFNK